MIRKLLALFTRPATMTAAEAHQAVTSDGAVLLDVREPSEWRAGHAPQARHLVLSQLQDHLDDLPTDRPIITVCRSGRRSAIAADTAHPPRLPGHQPHRWHERLGRRRPARHHQRRQARPGHLTPAAPLQLTLPDP